MIIFLAISLNMCFGCPKEPSHQHGSLKPSHRHSSFEYPQNTFWLRKKKTNSQAHTLIWSPEYQNLTNWLIYCFLPGSFTKPGIFLVKVSKKAKIRNQYNQVPHLTQDTSWESDKNARKHQ